MEAAVQRLKEALCTAAILTYPQPRERFVVDTGRATSCLEEHCPKYRTDRSE
jgi:hypothetical protein